MGNVVFVYKLNIVVNGLIGDIIWWS